MAKIASGSAAAASIKCSILWRRHRLIKRLVQLGFSGVCRNSFSTNPTMALSTTLVALVFIPGPPFSGLFPHDFSFSHLAGDIVMCGSVPDAQVTNQSGEVVPS